MRSDGFNVRLRRARADAGQSIRGLAAASELSQETIRLLQNGGRWPGIYTVERLATALNVTPQWLAYGAQPKETKMTDSDKFDFEMIKKYSGFDAEKLRRIKLATDQALGLVPVEPQRCRHHRTYPGADMCHGEPEDYCDTDQSARIKAARRIAAEVAEL